MIATKDQEREALKKIRKIVDDLGYESYLSLTFAGIWEQAEDNITNDLAINFKDAYDKTRDLYNESQKDIKALLSQNEELEDRIKAVERDRDKWRESYENTLKMANDFESELSFMSTQANDDVNKIKELKAEITTLKAKLYDFITV